MLTALPAGGVVVVLHMPVHSGQGTETTAFRAHDPGPFLRFDGKSGFVFLVAGLNVPGFFPIFAVITVGASDHVTAKVPQSGVQSLALRALVPERRLGVLFDAADSTLFFSELGSASLPSSAGGAFSVVGLKVNVK